MKKPKTNKAERTLSWFFEQVGTMGGASSRAYQNSLAGVGVPHAELFAREAIQNSVDAADVGAPSVNVQFRAEEVGGNRFETLRATLGMAAGCEPLKRAGLFRPGEGGDLATRLQPPLRLLYVEDFSTVGLGGTTEPVASTEEDNYFRLCLTLGDTRAREGGGGTFGYGKSVYWAMSSLWTIVLYSRFAPTARTNYSSARLIAVSWFNGHTQPDQSGREIRYTGRAWFGVVDERGCRPAVDDGAHDLAEQLRFRRRGPNDCGLSILILGSRVDMDGLREGVERHWWPRVLDGRLEVSFLLDGQELPSPRPRSHPRLARFVRAWDLAKGNAEPGTRDAVKELTYKRSVLGRFTITTGSEDHEEEFGDPQPAPRQVEIALIRDPGMVVEYLAGPTLSPTQPTCSAVFAADPSMNRVFGASEPPAHNKWDFRTIKRGELTDDQRAQIEQTLEKIRAAARAFVQSKQVPPPAPPARCRELERMLGKWIGLAPEPPPPPPPGIGPFHLRFVEEAHRVETESGVTLDARVEVSLREDLALEPEHLVRVRAWVDTVVDDGVAAPKEDRLQMSYISAREPGGAETPGEADKLGSFVTVVLSQGGLPWVVDLRSQALPHPEYRASLTVSAELE